MKDTLLSLNTPVSKSILLVGVGDAGCNMLRRIRDKYGEGNADFVYINTDANSLSLLKAVQGEKMFVDVRQNKIDTYENMGRYVEEVYGQKIGTMLEMLSEGFSGGPKAAIVFAGFGGKTGTGVTPLIARLLIGLHIPTFCVATVPFSFEGTQRMQTAENGLKSLHRIRELTTYVLPNNMLVDKNKGGISINDAFSLSDDSCVLPYEFIEGLLMKESDQVNVDFQDVNRLIRTNRTSYFTYGRGSGENRISDALNEIFTSPYLYGVDRNQISSILLQISTASAENLLFKDVVNALQEVQKHFSTQGSVDIVWGTQEDENLDDDIVIKAVVGCKTNMEISYLTAPTEYVVERSIPSDLELNVRNLKNDYPGKKIAFIIMRFGSGKAYDSIVSSIRLTLEPYGIVALRADDKEYHDDLFSNILTYIYACDFGVAIYENILDNRHNPNVALEVGVMYGLGKKVCLLKQRGTDMYSDITGKLYKEFDIQDIEETIHRNLDKWLKDKSLIW